MFDFYDEIFKRKSFHLFKNVGNECISKEELDGIENIYGQFDSLYPDIKTCIRIVSADKINLKRDAEYFILIYSEEKENYLMNAGYIGQQLDLYLVRNNIGSLWFGLGKPDMETYNGMKYVIMFAVRKVDDSGKFRKDMFKSKRKSLDEIWSGDYLEFADIARFSPSACNSQPWYVENKNGKLTVYRYRKNAKIGIMPVSAASYFNRIDIGIYLCISEICMNKKGIKFNRKLFADNGTEAEYTKVAEYGLITE